MRRLENLAGPQSRGSLPQISNFTPRRSKMRVLFRLGLIATLCSWLLCTAMAQENTGSISGTVKDQTGAVIPNAKVILIDTDKNVVARSAKSGGGGEFSFPSLPIGHYSVTVEMPNFQTYTQTGMALSVNDRLQVNATLQVGSESQKVTVEASGLQVNLESAVATGVVNGTQIRELAMTSRNYMELV